jgi:hypothetical protein
MLGEDSAREKTFVVRVCEDAEQGRHGRESGCRHGVINLSQDGVGAQLANAGLGVLSGAEAVVLSILVRLDRKWPGGRVISRSPGMDTGPLLQFGVAETTNAPGGPVVLVVRGRE